MRPIGCASLRPVLTTVAIIAGLDLDSALGAESDPRGLPAVAALADRALAADYRADIPELHEIARALEPFTADPAAAGRARYWRGFAYWRSAINLWNGDPKNARIPLDLDRAAAEFAGALDDPTVAADAKSARAAAILVRSGILGGSPEQRRAIFAEYQRLMSEAKASALDNPRVRWIDAYSLYYTPSPRGGADAAIAALAAAAAIARKSAPAPIAVATPSWGLPELEMAIAWMQMNRPDPRPEEADRAAHRALALAPTWHYLQAFLVPQIHARLGQPDPAAACPLEKVHSASPPPGN